MVAILLSLFACAPTPDSIKFDGDTNAKVSSTDPLPVLKVQVLDKEKKAITPAPELSWSVSPADCAKLEGTNVKPTKEAGKCAAKVEAMVKGTPVKGSYSVTVVIANNLEVTGYNAGSKLEVGKDVTLTATVKADDEVLADSKVEWTSSDANIAKIEAGKVVGVAEGKATVTATSGKATASAEIEVGPAVAVAVQ
jgi:Bacterial Ig-like domain (group 2)